MKRNQTLRMTVEGAMFVALAQVLGYVKLLRMPWGGSVSLIMLPIIIFSVRWGWKQGLVAGLTLGLLQFLLDFSYGIGWQSIIGDYILPYTLVGLAGLFRGTREGVFLGGIVGSLGRFAVLTITGATVWGEYMPEEFLGMAMTNTWVYSALYNMIPVGLSFALCAVVLAAIYVPLRRYLTGEDISKS